MSQCPHGTLGIRRTASAAEIRKAYRHAALRTHPDKPGGSHEAFDAVQRAYEALGGVPTVAPTAPTWSWTAAADSGPDGGFTPCTSTPGLSSFGAAPAPTFNTWSTSAQTVDPWSTTGSTFDPWSSTSTPAFDPWSSASTSMGFKATTAAAVAAAAQAAAVQAATNVPVAGAPEQVVACAVGGNTETKKKRKNRNSDALALPSQKVMRRRPVDRDGNFKIDPRENDGSKALTRFGVYGFRPEEDSTDEEEDSAGPAIAPQPAMNAPGPFAVPEMPRRCTTPPVRVNAPRAEKHFYCILHKKLRPESALVDDGHGSPVCRPGMECP